MTETNTKLDFKPYIDSRCESYQIDDTTCIVVVEAPGYTRDDLTATLSLKGDDIKCQQYHLTIEGADGRNRFTNFNKSKFAKYNDVMAKFADKLKYKFKQTVVFGHPTDYNFNFAVDCVDGLVYIRIVAEKIKTAKDVKLNFGKSVTTENPTKRDDTTEDKQPAEDFFDRINKHFYPWWPYERNYHYLDEERNDEKPQRSRTWKTYTTDSAGPTLASVNTMFEDFDRLFKRL